MIREEVVKRCLLKVTNIYTFFIVDLRYKLLREGHSAIILVLNLLEPAVHGETGRAGLTGYSSSYYAN